MRVRPIVVLGGVFGASVLVALFVVRQLPREGQVSPPGAMPPEPQPASPADAPASPSDGTAVVRAVAGGEPQANALVSLYRADPGADPCWRRAGTGRTGADGIVRIPARPGLYLAAVRAPGLAPGLAELVRPAGEETSRAEVELAPPASLDGVVRVRGRATPSDVRVQIVASPGIVGPGLCAPAEEIVRADADGAGRFHVAGLPPGIATAIIEAPGFHPVRLERVAIPRTGPVEIELEPLAAVEGRVLLASGRPAAGAVVHATSAAHGAIEKADAAGRFTLSLPAGEYALLASADGEAGAHPSVLTVARGARQAGVEVRLGPAAAVDVQAVLASGAPAAGAAVTFARHDAGGNVLTVITRADGRFDAGGLAPGAYDVTATLAGATPARIGGITLAPGQRFAIRAELPGLGAIEGAVLDPSGKPLSGARVRVVSRGDGLARTFPLEARSDFEGRYRIDGVEAGRAEVVATEAGAGIGDARAVRVEAGRAARADFFVPASGFLSGRVTADGKKPPLGTAVVAVPLRAGLGTSQIARALADASGNYVLAVPAGEYRVHAAPVEAPLADLRVPPAFTHVEPRLTTRLDLAVAPAATMDGLEVVVVEPGGAPSPSAIVTLSRPGDGKVALALTAGEDGRVLIPRNLGTGANPVTVRARNGGRTGAFTGPLPATGELVVRLVPGAALEGVLRASGRTVKGFTLEVTSQPTPEGWRTVDVHRFSGDRFALGDLPSEPLRLSVRTDDGRRGEALVRLTAGESRGLEITLAGSPAGR